MVVEARRGTLVEDPGLRLQQELDVLLGWIADPGRSTRYLLIRDRLYDRFAPALQGLTTEVYREPDLNRNKMVLLQVDPPGGAVASADADSSPGTGDTPLR
jgi:hypothetical protein